MNDAAPPTFFSLIDEPWLAVLDDTGQRTEVSLLDVFRRAGSIRGISGELPTQDFAILRVLLAVLHRAVGGPQDLDHWREIKADWDSAAADVAGYLSRFRDRFWLMHPECPFMQVAGLHTSKSETSDLSKIICDGSGSSSFLTTRLGEHRQSLGWAEAARWLIHAQAFDVAGIHSGAQGDPRVKGGKGYGIGTGWAGQLGGVHMVGDSLSETLMLNLLVPSIVGIEVTNQDLPIWERAPLTPAPQGWPEDAVLPAYRPPSGPLDVYTWASRRILLGGTASRSTSVVNCQGDKLTGHNGYSFEPMSGWRYSDPQSKTAKRDTYMPARHQPGRALWRGLAGLLPLGLPGTSGSGPPPRRVPAIVEWAARLEELGAIDQRLVRVRAVGMTYGTKESAYDEAFNDELELPSRLLSPASRDLADEAVSAAGKAIEAVTLLGSLARDIALASGASQDSGSSRQQVQAWAYFALDGEFRQKLRGLVDTASAVEWGLAWQITVRRIVTRLADRAVDEAGPAALVGREAGGVFRDAGLAIARFRKNLRRVLPDAYLDLSSTRKEGVA
ncbi:MAG: type I-E CRISPR-associated protein Cse1/CasA [Micrococcales bacterium]|nr:type I-E CRISPR-associated protein Cse1/CasA [Micrococcales bacterium]